MQLFFIDTADDLTNDMLAKKDLHRDLVSMITSVLSNNPYSLVFKRLRSWDDLANAHIVIRSSCKLDQRNCNVPSADQVAGIWKDGDTDAGDSVRDIRVYTESGRTQKINYYYGSMTFFNTPYCTRWENLGGIMILRKLLSHPLILWVDRSVRVQAGL